MEENKIIAPKSEIQTLIDNISEAKDTFDEQEFLTDKYDEWLQAVQQNAPQVHLFVDEEDWKAHNSPRWDENTTYELWLKGCLDEIETVQLPEVEKKLRKGNTELSPFQKQIEGLADELEFVDDKEMDKMDRLYHEFMEWYLRKSQETIKKFFKGEIKFLEKDVIKGMVEREFADMVQKTIFKSDLLI